MFCKYCGNQVPDGYVCNCPDAQAARAAAAAPVATAYAPQAAAPAANNIVGDALKSTPNALKSLLGNTEGFGIALPTAIVLAIGGLILNILAWVLMVSGIQGGIKDAMGIASAAVWPMIKKALGGMYGAGVLGGLWTCLIPIVLSMAIIVIGQMVRKEQMNLAGAFITGACVNIAPSALFLVGALFTTFLPVVGILLILVAVIAGLAADYKLLNKAIANTNGIVGGLIAAAIVAVVLGLMAWIVYGVITGYVEDLGGKLGSAMGGLGGIGDLGDMLGDLF